MLRTLLASRGPSTELLCECAAELDLRPEIVPTADELVKIPDRTPAALIVVDMHLPDAHGIDVCRRLRRETDAPIIVLGDGTGDADRVLALEVGADDFVEADCGRAELLERMRAALRRSSRPAPVDGVLDFGRIRIDRDRLRLHVGERTEDLTPMELDLIWALAMRPGETVPSEDLLRDVWGYPPGVRTRTLDVHIGRLRRKLGEDGRNPQHIITVRRVGYRFEPGADNEEEADAA